MEIYFDGEFVTEAKVSIFDRGFLFGDGAYATIQVRDGYPLFADRHLARLTKVLEGLNIVPPPLTESLLHDIIARNGATSGFYRLRLFITGGDSPARRLPKRPHGHVIGTIEPWPELPYGPLRLALFPYPLSLCHASFKSLAHLNRYYVAEYAHQQQCDDAVTVTEAGHLLEASFGNLAWIVDKTVYTPDLSLSLHPGVTLGVFLEMAKARNFDVVYVKKRLDELPDGAFVFRTNTMGGIRPVIQIEQRLFGRDLSLEEALQSDYAAFSAAAV